VSFCLKSGSSTVQSDNQNQPAGNVETLLSDVKPERVITPKALMILAEGRDAMLATLRPDGWPQATVINYVNDEERIYFDCAVASQKAYNISRDDRVSLALVVPYSAFGPIYGLSLAGHAKLIEASAELLHILELWKARYPSMRERVEQDRHDFAFYAIAPTVLTLPDYAVGLGHRH
jgi:general stress protein 26